MRIKKTLFPMFPPPTKNGMRVILAFFVFLLMGINDSILGIMLPSIQTSYHVTPATIGIIFIATTIGYVIGSLSNGSLIELFGLRRVLIGGSIVYIGGAGLFGLTPPYPFICVASVFIGLGIACLDAGLNSYIARLPKNMMLLNYLHAFFGLGALLGPIMASSFLAMHWIWSSVYLVLGTMGIVILISTVYLFQTHLSMQKEQTQELRTLLTTTMKLRVVWFAVFFLLFYGGIEVSLGNWSYSLLTEKQHVVPLFAGWIVSGYWFGLTCGRVLLGKLGERVGSLRLIQGCLLGTFVGLLLTWWDPTQVVVAFGLGITGFCLGPLFPTTLALMSTRVPSFLVPNVIGLLASQGNIGGALFSWGAGNMAQYIGFSFLLPYIIVLTTLMQAIWMGLRKPQDRR